MRLDTQIVRTPDGVDLFVRRYGPDQPDPLKTLYWVHGLGEHGGRHVHVAEYLAQHGWTMIIPDLRGHGQSTGVRTFVKSFGEYTDDIKLLWDRFDLHNDRTILLGHSMGGLVAVRAAQSGAVTPSSLVISSPLLGIKQPINPVTILLGRLLVRFKPDARFSNGIDPANMTHDRQFAEIRRGDKLINKTVTAAWFFAMKEALEAAHRDAGKVSLPVLSLHGTMDRTTDLSAMSKWWDRIASTEKKMLILEGHFHELFFEPDWRSTMAQLVDWLNEQYRSSAPGAAALHRPA